MSEEAEPVLYEQRGAVAIVTMNRPEFRNAQNAKMTYTLDAAFNRAIDDDSVKVIVLAGAGKHFSAGHDIGSPGRDIDRPFPRIATNWWKHEDKPRAENIFVREQEMYLGMCRRWRNIPKPTIAMVQGACVAGALMLAWVCYLIVASDDAFFADPVVKMGIPGVEYFAHAHAMNPRLAKEFLYQTRPGRPGRHHHRTREHALRHPRQRGGRIHHATRRRTPLALGRRRRDRLAALR